MRELSDASVRDQAEAYLEYEARSGLTRGRAFDLWAQSKDFSLEDVRAIRRHVQHLRVARALATSAGA
jgi:hypothetical protein